VCRTAKHMGSFCHLRSKARSSLPAVNNSFVKSWLESWCSTGSLQLFSFGYGCNPQIRESAGRRSQRGHDVSEGFGDAEEEPLNGKKTGDLHKKKKAL
jgi:hypothetical protein